MDPVTKATEAFLKSLAGILREERQKSGLSRTELAARAGLSRPHVGYLETGERQPSAESLKRLSLALGITVSDLAKRAEDATDQVST